MKASATKLNRRPLIGGSLVFQITLPESVGRRLEQAAYDERRTPTNMISWIVGRYLDEQGISIPALSITEVSFAHNAEDPSDVDW